MRAIEVTGTIDANHRLLLDQPLPASTHGQVRVIILLQEQDADEASEAAWLQAASQNPAFDFLKDPQEDIYSNSDGKPFYG